MQCNSIIHVLGFALQKKVLPLILANILYLCICILMINVVIKRISSILILVAFLPALLGVHVVHHVCHLSSHHNHVDLELLAGISSSTYCSSPENHCCDADEGTSGHDCSDCKSEYVVLDAVHQSIITKVEFSLQPMAMTIFCVVVSPFSSVVDGFVIPPILNCLSLSDSDWQSFSGVYRC